ncbi:unnamed protein product [Rotaria sp. Silwood1]|nr:unnamed protein product [Rotaria sp. Silwood1]
MENYQFVIIGGGISGVTCVESIATFDSTARILLLTGTPLIKAITNYVSKFLEEFDIEEKPFHYLAERFPNLIIQNKVVERLETEKQIIICSDNTQIHYDQLCICTGARPKLLSNTNPYVCAIRDTETVESFQKKLASAKQIVIVGNGGIATELVYEVEHCSVIWAIKDEHISTAFFDEAAARFFLDRIEMVKEKQKMNEKRQKYEMVDQPVDPTHIRTSSTKICGGALGPDWATHRSMKGAFSQPRQVHIEYQVEVKNILTPEQYQQRKLTIENLQSSEEEIQWPVYVELTNGKIFGCDFVVCAIGVTPNVELFLQSADFKLGADGGLLVDETMRTSIKNIFACGDVCTAGWTFAEHWFQMRLWSQARQMGYYAGKCMLAYANNEQDSLAMDFCFELFAHTTKFFNMKVVLLGKYHEKDMKKYDNLIRMTPGEEYIRITLKDGRVHGCIFIGDTELEETFENLILNQIDVSAYELQIISSIDIEQSPLTVIGDKNVTRQSNLITKSFSKLSINGLFYCYVTWTDHKQTMDIYTDNNIHPYVIVHIEQDTLEIAIQFDANFKFTKMDIYLYIHPTIDEIFLGGISTLHSTNVLKTDSLLKLHIQDTSSLILQLDIFNLDALFLSAGTTKLIGHVNDKAIIKYDGIGDVDASQLFCKFVDIEANGLGTIWITGTEECFIKAEGVSIVRYNCTNIHNPQVTGLAKIIPV